MTTTTYTIGTGKDYTTLSDFVADTGILTDLVANTSIYELQCYAGSNLGSADFSSFNTDSDNYIKITAASGNQFTNTFDDGASCSWTGKQFNVGSSVVVIDGMRLLSGHLVAGFNVTSANCNLILNNCYISMIDTLGTGTSVDLITATNFKGQITNTIISVISQMFESGGTLLKLSASTANDAISNVSIFSDNILISGLDLGTNISCYNTASIYINGSFTPVGGNYVPWASSLGGTAKLYNCATSDTAFTGYTNVTDCLTSIVYTSNYDYPYTIKSSSTLRKAGKQIDSVTSDILGNQRVYYDIGAIQTNIIDTGDLANIFADLKLFINPYVQYKSTIQSTIDSLTSTKIARLTSDKNRITLLAETIQTDTDNKDSLDKMADSEVDYIKDYIEGYLKSKMYSANTAINDLLDELDYWLGINLQTIKQIDLNYVTKQISTGDGSIGSIVIPQLIQPQVIEIKCTSASTAGSEKWSVTGSVSGSMDTATTNVTYTDSNTGLSFKISTKTSTNWAIGDKFQIFITADSTGLFQSFFRDEFEFTFDNNSTNGTISES
jgi:hypothetical protein